MVNVKSNQDDKSQGSEETGEYICVKTSMFPDIHENRRSVYWIDRFPPIPGPDGKTQFCENFNIEIMATAKRLPCGYRRDRLPVDWLTKDMSKITNPLVNMTRIDKLSQPKLIPRPYVPNFAPFVSKPFKLSPIFKITYNEKSNFTTSKSRNISAGTVENTLLNELLEHTDNDLMTSPRPKSVSDRSKNSHQSTSNIFKSVKISKSKSDDTDNITNNLENPRTDQTNISKKKQSSKRKSTKKNKKIRQKTINEEFHGERVQIHHSSEININATQLIVQKDLNKSEKVTSASNKVDSNSIIEKPAGMQLADPSTLAPGGEENPEGVGDWRSSVANKAIVEDISKADTTKSKDTLRSDGDDPMPSLIIDSDNKPATVPELKEN